MKYILTPDQITAADKAAIEIYNIPSVVLMENAARSSTEEIIDIFEVNSLENPEIIILCGSGNNGGDGFAIARHLIIKDFDVRILWIGSTDKMSEETFSNYDSACKIGIPIMHIQNEKDLYNFDFTCDVLIDALIGVGGSENIKGIALSILKKVCQLDALKIAVDVPTGLNSTNGFASDFCFAADYTITMFALKTGLVLNDGIDYCGEIVVAYLGAPEFIIESMANAFYLENSDIDNILPPRDLRTSKYDYGKTLIIAGSQDYPGAAALCANACVKTGAGLTTLLSTNFHHSLWPEVITIKGESTPSGTLAKSNYNEILKRLNTISTLVIGPGLGGNEETTQLIRDIISNLPDHINLVIDADGLRAINPDSKLKENIILTPHCSEFARLTGLEYDEVILNSSDLALEWAKKLNCTVLLKNVPTVTSNGIISCYNLTGNPGMAKGGSGDVLTGIIGGLLAQHVEPFEAAALGAFLHSEAADLAIIDNATETLTASEIINNLSKVLDRR